MRGCLFFHSKGSIFNHKPSFPSTSVECYPFVHIHRRFTVLGDITIISLFFGRFDESPLLVPWSIKEVDSELVLPCFGDFRGDGVGSSAKSLGFDDF